MSLIPYRANLSSAVFPMTLADAGRTVIAPQYDQNFDRRVDPAGEQKDAGIPQAIYMENVIPTVNGFQSVGYRALQSIPLASRTINCQITVPILETVSTQETIYTYELIFYNDDTVDCNVSDGTASAGWTAAVLPVGFISPLLEDRVSFAVVRGITYLLISGNPPYAANEIYTLERNSLVNPSITFTNASGSLSGITAAEILYITSAANYMIAVGVESTIYWSSTTTPTDFTTSLVTGAGSQIPSGIRTDVRYALTHPEGFYLYTQDAVIFAAYTGNSRYPWRFKEIPNSPGIGSAEQITHVANLPYQIAIDRTGKIFIIAPDSVETIAPEVSNFLERSLTRDVFNYSTNVFTKYSLTELSDLYVVPTAKVTYVLNRYIVVSYSAGPGNTFLKGFNYAIVYDMQLQRYGKLKIPHDKIISSGSIVTFVDYTTGVCTRLILNVYDSTATFSGVLLLGKFQFVRDRHLQLEEIAIESVRDASYGTQNFSLLLWPSLDGKNFQTPTTLTCTFTDELITAKTHKTAKNHSLMLKGSFNVNTLDLRFRVAGER
jgi:hypothetical protein